MCKAIRGDNSITETGHTLWLTGTVYAAQGHAQQQCIDKLANILLVLKSLAFCITTLSVISIGYRPLPNIVS